MGLREKALREYERAAEMATNGIEQRYLRRRIEELK